MPRRREVIRGGLSPWRRVRPVCTRVRGHCLDNLAVILHAVSSVSQPRVYRCFYANQPLPKTDGAEVLEFNAETLGPNFAQREQLARCVHKFLPNTRGSRSRVNFGFLERVRRNRMTKAEQFLSFLSFSPESKIIFEKRKKKNSTRRSVSRFSTLFDFPSTRAWHGALNAKDLHEDYSSCC